MHRTRYVVILAATKREGYQYAQRAGIPARNCRIPLYAKQITGIVAADCHVLPSFKMAPHRHAILAAIRQVRSPYADIRLFDVEMPAKADAPVEDQGDGMGPQLTIFDALDEAHEATTQILDHVITHTDEATLAEAFDHRLVEHVQSTLEDGHAVLEEIVEEDEDGEEAGEAEPGEDAAPDEDAKPRRRRSRCAECGELRFPDDHECPAASPRTRLTGGFF